MQDFNRLLSISSLNIKSETKSHLAKVIPFTFKGEIEQRQRFSLKKASG